MSRLRHRRRLSVTAALSLPISTVSYIQLSTARANILTYSPPDTQVLLSNKVSFKTLSRPTLYAMTGWTPAAAHTLHNTLFTSATCETNCSAYSFCSKQVLTMVLIRLRKCHDWVLIAR